MATDDRLVFNGIDATTGDYLTPRLSVEEVSALAQGEELDPEQARELQRRLDQGEAHYGAVEGVDPHDLASAGWGVIFPQNSPPAIRAALADLLTLRQAQAGKEEAKRYREFTGAAACRTGETARAFFNRHGVMPAMPADPDKVPYYLLIVASPETIPYSFQFQADVQYAVGR